MPAGPRELETPKEVIPAARLGRANPSLSGRSQPQLRWRRSQGGSLAVGPGRELESWLRTQSPGGWGRSSVPTGKYSSLVHLCPRRTTRVKSLRRREGLEPRVCSNKTVVSMRLFELVPVCQVDGCRFFLGGLPGGLKFSRHLYCVTPCRGGTSPSTPHLSRKPRAGSDGKAREGELCSASPHTPSRAIGPGLRGAGAPVAHEQSANPATS